MLKHLFDILDKYFFIIFLLIFTNFSCSALNKRYNYADMAMGTIVRLTLVSHNEKFADSAAKKALTMIHKLADDFDHRNIHGSVGRINANAGKLDVSVSNECFLLIKRAINFCDQTKGIFDITIGAYSTILDYYKTAFDNTKKNKINYKLIQLNNKKKSVYLSQKGMAIDLGGLAKGAIIDEATKILINAGIRYGIVEAGGDFYCFGNKKWKIGILHPRYIDIIGRVSIIEKGVCGSGDYYQYVIEKNSQALRKHHIINPQTMKSANKSIGVTVIAHSAELADALATTLFIMGSEKGICFLEKHFSKSSAMWVLPDLTFIKTNNFPEFLAD